MEKCLGRAARRPLPARRDSRPGRFFSGAAGIALGSALGAALLTGCAHYAPRPRPPERAAADFAARTFADPGLRAALDAQRPGRSAVWPRLEWDRADLLVAMLHFNDSLAAARAA